MSESKDFLQTQANTTQAYNKMIARWQIIYDRLLEEWEGCLAGELEGGESNHDMRLRELAWEIIALLEMDT